GNSASRWHPLRRGADGRVAGQWAGPRRRRTRPSRLAPGDGPHDQVRLPPGCNFRGQRIIQRVLRMVLFARIEPQERPALLGHRISHCSPKHWVLGLERVEHRTLRDISVDAKLDFPANPRERAKVGRQHDPDHDSVWTWTDRTDGRLFTIALHESPASAET